MTLLTPANCRPAARCITLSGVLKVPTVVSQAERNANSCRERSIWVISRSESGWSHMRKADLNGSSIFCVPWHEKWSQVLSCNADNALDLIASMLDILEKETAGGERLRTNSSSGSTHSKVNEAPAGQFWPMAAKGTDGHLSWLLQAFISTVIEGVYEEIYCCKRYTPFALYSPAACNSKKLKKDVGHHHIQEPHSANGPRFFTTTWTTSSHNSAKAVVSAGGLLCWSLAANIWSFSRLVRSGILVGGCLCRIIMALQDNLLVMSTMMGPLWAASWRSENKGGRRKREKPSIFQISSTVPFQSFTKRLYQASSASTLILGVASRLFTGGLSRRELRSLNFFTRAAAWSPCVFGGFQEECGVLSSGSR